MATYDPFEQEILGYQQQRETARKLREQAMQPLEGQMISGHYVAPSWTQGLANALRGYIAGQQEEEATRKMLQAGERQQALTAADTKRMAEILRGTPEQRSDFEYAQMEGEEPIKGLQNIDVAGKPGDLNEALNAANYQSPQFRQMVSQKALERAMAQFEPEDTVVVDGALVGKRTGKVVYPGTSGSKNISLGISTTGVPYLENKDPNNLGIHVGQMDANGIIRFPTYSPDFQVSPQQLQALAGAQSMQPTNAPVGGTSPFAKPPGAPETRVVERGEQKVTEEFNPQTRTWNPIGQAPRVPTPIPGFKDEQIVAVMKNGKATYVPKSQAVGMTPANSTTMADSSGLPKAPPGMRYTPEGNLMPIPGSKQDIDFREQIKKDYTQTRSAVQKGIDIQKFANELKEHPGFGSATGWRSYLPSAPETPMTSGQAKDFDTKLKAFQGKVTSIGKQLSSESGALGNMAIQEWAIVANAVANIDPHANPKELRNQLDEAITAANNFANRTKDAYEKQYSPQFNYYPEFRLGGPAARTPAPAANDIAAQARAELERRKKGGK